MWSKSFTRLSKGGQRHKIVLHIPFRVLWYNSYNVNQQMHTLRYNYSNILTYTNSCIFQASLALHQEVNSSIKQSFAPIIISNMWNRWKFINGWCRDRYVRNNWSSTVITFKPTGCSSYCAHIRLCKSYVDELLTVPHIGDHNRGKRLFYATVNSPIPRQGSPKHVRVCVH